MHKRSLGKASMFQKHAITSDYDFIVDEIEEST